jgi:hypothetical protein
MDTREQERQQALQALQGVSPAEAWDIETGCEVGWGFAKAYPNASVEEIRQEANRQAQVRKLGESFRNSFISAALGGVYDILF